MTPRPLARGLLALGLGLAALPLGSSAAPAQTPATPAISRRALRVTVETPISLRTTVGDITVAGWDRPRVEIDMTADTAVETADHEVRIAAVQPNGQRDARLRSSITVHAPFDQAFGEVDLFEGRISLRDLRRGLRARVDHGSIDASALSGTIRLETGIGDIRLDRATLTDPGMLRLRAFNGNVDLGFAATPADARILALALGGTIRSDIPLTLKTTFGPRFGEATLGRGHLVVSIDVVKGDIRIARGKG